MKKVTRAPTRAIAAALALIALAGLSASCGIKKKISAAKDAINTVKSIGQDVAKQAGQPNEGGKSEDRLSVDKLLEKANGLSGISYKETAVSEGKTIKGEIFMKNGKMLRHSWQDGSEFIALVDGNDITFADMKSGSGFKQKADSPEDARGMIDILSGNLFVRPDKMLAADDDLKKVGAESVVGQACDIYEVKYGLLGASAAIRVWMSKEYGLVMKALISGGEAGKKTDTYEYQITEFKTSGVKDSDLSLPAGIQITDMANIGKDVPAAGTAE